MVILGYVKFIQGHHLGNDGLVKELLHFQIMDELFGDIFQSLRSGGVLLLMEPARAEPPFAPGFDAWKKQQPSQHKYEDWRRFWSRVKNLIGHDYGFLGDPPDNQNRIGDGLSAMQWVGLLTDAGFESIDILMRDAEKIVLASVKP